MQDSRSCRIGCQIYFTPKNCIEIAAKEVNRLVIPSLSSPDRPQRPVVSMLTTPKSTVLKIMAKASLPYTQPPPYPHFLYLFQSGGDPTLTLAEPSAKTHKSKKASSRNNKKKHNGVGAFGPSVAFLSN